MKTTELAVIGAGPGGLSAAIASSQAGICVTVIDEYPVPGGQYLRGKGSPRLSRTEERARKLLRQLHDSKDITLKMGTLVWGIEDSVLALHDSDGISWLEAENIVVAAGARELAIPFPGWTLPGVMTVGAAQILAKAHGVAPGKRALIAGSGPMLLAGAAALATQGLEVLGVMEASLPPAWMRHVSAVIGNTDRLREGDHYLKILRQSQIPYRFGRTVIRAEGEKHLTATITARLDREGKPIPGSEECIALDTLCLNFGFVPNIELTQLAGCEHDYVKERGGWVPIVDENMQTSVSGLYAVGETAGVGGANAALLEGEIAGLAIVGEFDKAAILQRRLRPLKRFSAMLNTLFSPRPALDVITADKTILCRCEEVSAGEIRQAIGEGARTLNDLKNWTHAGQGPCQGRTCGPISTRILANETGCAPGDSGQFRPRPPLKPIPLGALAQERRQ